LSYHVPADLTRHRSTGWIRVKTGVGISNMVALPLTPP
jgi:hypothetical protein